MATKIDPAVEKAAEEFRHKFTALRDEIGKAIVGHKDVVEGVLTALFTGGHVLIEGVPGLGKTYLIRTLAQAVDLEYSRIQFTPDLMPADIIGTTIISEEHANRVPDEFYASRGGRRVYLPTDTIFEHGGSSLRPGGDLDLMRVSALLSLPGKPHVQIQVHTDAGGSREKQLELSRRRAANIRSWLLARGHVDAKRFDVIGVGSSQPVVPPDGSYTAQSPNRRIEIRVVQ